MVTAQHIVVAGASLAGVRAAEELRRAGYEGRITLVGAEVHFPPFDRPPLSKQLLAGAWEPSAARLRVDPGLDADVRLGSRAGNLDVSRRTVDIDGAPVSFDGLVVATGARARTMNSSDGLPDPPVHVLRSVDDCLRIKEGLISARRIAVIGSGFVGCEVASTCRALGREVAMVDLLPEPMLRSLGSQMGAVVAALHRRHGVELCMGRKVLGMAFDDGGTSVHLEGGEPVHADLVVVAIGAIPETGWLEGSGLDLHDGVVCDEACFAAGADTVVAAGDVARWRHPVLGTSVRVEHWSNAVSQAKAAAHNLVARLTCRADVQPYATLPYFWSDQYDWKIQFVGIPGEDVTVEEGTVACGKFVAGYRSGGRLVGALCVNWPARLHAYRKRIVAEHELPHCGARGV